MNQKFKGLVSNLPLEIKKIIMIKMLDDILQACHGHISVADQATKDLRILKLAFGDADFTTAFKPALERFERHCCIDPSEYASAQRKLFGDICASNEQPHLPGRVKSNGADFDLALNSAKELNDRRAVGECYKQRRANMEWAATRWSYECKPARSATRILHSYANTTSRRGLLSIRSLRGGHRHSPTQDESRISCGTMQVW